MHSPTVVFRISTVIDVGEAVVCGRRDVVDLTPGGRDAAAGDHATAVAQGDRPSLLRGEAALRRTEFDDATVVVDDDALHPSRAGELPDRVKRNGRFHTVDVP